MKQYLLDSNSFMMPARNYYNFNILPTYWNILLQFANKYNNLYVLSVVENEINADLKQSLDWANERENENVKRISELEEENAKLQAKIDDWQSEYIELENLKNSQLTQAKKIIGNLYAICKDNHYPNSSVLMEQAEQFLNEVEYE